MCKQSPSPRTLSPPFHPFPPFLFPPLISSGLFSAHYKSSYNLFSTHSFLPFTFVVVQYLCLLIVLSFSSISLARLVNCIHFSAFPSFPLLFSFSPLPPASSCPSLTSVTLPMKSELGSCFPAFSFAPHPSITGAAGALAACIISGCRSEGNPAPLPRRRQSPACPFMVRGYPPSQPDAAHVWAATKLAVGGIPLAGTVQ